MMINLMAHKIVFLALLFAALSVEVSRSNAADARLKIDALAEGSKVVFVGKVVSIRVTDAGPAGIYTQHGIKVQVLKILKGKSGSVTSLSFVRHFNDAEVPSTVGGTFLFFATAPGRSDPDLLLAICVLPASNDIINGTIDAIKRASSIRGDLDIDD